MLLMVALTAWHVFKGSQSKFAYVLVLYTFGFGIYDIFGKFVVTGLPRNDYVSFTFNYMYYLLFLQGWIFSMKYLDSAVLSMQTTVLN